MPGNTFADIAFRAKGDASHNAELTNVKFNFDAISPNLNEPQALRMRVALWRTADL